MSANTQPISSRLARTFRRTTSRLRPLPDFLLIGAPKAGTTSLFHYISEHEQVCPAVRKEVLYFDRNHHLGEAYYRSFFPSSIYRSWKSMVLSRPTVTGEASPYNLQHPLVPQRVHDILPNVKLIAILRDPVERAWSFYRHNVSHHRESESFEVALQEELASRDSELSRIRDDPDYSPMPFLHRSYIHGGLYAQHLENWLGLFDREQLLVIESGELSRTPQDCMAAIADFLKIEPFKRISSERKNQGRIEQAIPRQVENELSSLFATENQRLFDLLGKSFDWT